MAVFGVGLCAMDANQHFAVILILKFAH